MNPSTAINFMTYNINYSRRAVEEYAQYSWENRRGDVYKLIQSTESDVIFLQEVLSKNQDEVQASLSEHKWYFEPTNSRDGVCCNGIGIKRSFLPQEEPREFSFNFNRFEKSAEKVMGVLIGDLCLLNAHCPMEEKGRMAMASNFNHCLPNDREYRVIIAGDFNSFPDVRGQEQVETISTVTGAVRVSDLAIAESSKELAIRSFKAYPYDVVPEGALKLAGKLDHIFVKGLKLADKTTPIVLDAKIVEGMDFAPSDHYPIKAVLQ